VPFNHRRITETGRLLLSFLLILFLGSVASGQGFNDDDALLLAEGAAVSRLLTLLSDKDAFNRDVISFANGTMKDSFMPIVYVAAIMRYYVSTTST
jgi:hypothetical protein